MSDEQFKHYAHIYDNGGTTALAKAFKNGQATVEDIQYFFSELAKRDGLPKNAAKLVLSKPTPQLPQE